jgi:GNAT superfamily N-acetyltransferase
MDENMLECNESDVEYIGKEIMSYNLSKGPFTQEIPFTKLNFKIEENGKIIAGIVSVLYCWNCLFIDLLFVDENYRNKGYGTLLLEKVEKEARKHGCHLIHLDTFDFQAKDFYLKNGFELFGLLPDCPKGHTRYYMKKILEKSNVN